MKKIVVVGSGLAGLLCSLILLRRNYQVVLLESAAKVGGLLSRSYAWKDCTFDYGTHFLSSTGVEEIDRELFGENFELTKGWIQIPVLKSGSFYAGKLNKNTHAIDLRNLPSNDYMRICTELLERDEPSSETITNLNDWLNESFGRCMNQQVYEPIMKKFYGVGTAELDRSAARLIGLTRVILGSNFITQQLKKNPFFDQIISFQNRAEGASSLKVFYPKTGVAEWVDSIFEECMSHERFSVLLEQRVQQIEKQADKYVVKSNDSNIMDIDGVIWTGPVPVLNKMINEEFSHTEPVKWRRGDLYHFVFDQPFLTDLYYVVCYEPNMFSYRMTFYSNFNPASVGYHCTVEVVRDFKDSLLDHQVIENELRSMALVQGKLIHAKVETLDTGFPVPSDGLAKTVERMQQNIHEQFPDLVLLGKNAGRSFFMKDVIVDVFNEINTKEF